MSDQFNFFPVLTYQHGKPFFDDRFLFDHCSFAKLHGVRLGFYIASRSVGVCPTPAGNGCLHTKHNLAQWSIFYVNTLHAFCSRISISDVSFFSPRILVGYQYKTRHRDTIFNFPRSQKLCCDCVEQHDLAIDRNHVSQIKWQNRRERTVKEKNLKYSVSLNGHTDMYRSTFYHLAQKQDVVRLSQSAKLPARQVLRQHNLTTWQRAACHTGFKPGAGCDPFLLCGIQP